jgi:hypothetical protein
VQWLHTDLLEKKSSGKRFIINFCFIHYVRADFLVTNMYIRSACEQCCEGKLVTLSPCVPNYALYHEDVFGSGCTEQRILGLGTSWK